MLSAPDAPAPTAMQSSAVNADTGSIWPGATMIPAKPVKITSDITRGFNSAKKSPTVAMGCSTANVSAKSISLLPRSRDARQFVIGVERRRRGQRPFQGRCAHAPRIVARDALLHERLGHRDQEHDDAKARDESADGRHVIPARERVRIIRDAARHAGEAQKVHREEGEIDADEGDPEVNLAKRLIVHVAGDLRKPEIPAGEDVNTAPSDST